MLFEPDEQPHAVLASKSAHEAVTVLMDSAKEIGRHPGVESAVSLGCKNVNEGLEVSTHYVRLAGFPLSRE